MEITHGHPRINIRGRGGIIRGHIKPAMIHDVIKINADPEPSVQSHHSHQFIFGSVSRRNRAAPILVTKIEGVEESIPHRVPAPSLAGGGRPETGVARL